MYIVLTPNIKPPILILIKVYGYTLGTYGLYGVYRVSDRMTDLCVLWKYFFSILLWFYLDFSVLVNQ